MIDGADSDLVIDELMTWEIRNWITGKLEVGVTFHGILWLEMFQNVGFSGKWCFENFELNFLGTLREILGGNGVCDYLCD